MTAVFPIGTPALSRGTADRDEDLRGSDRLIEQWPTARVLTVAPDFRVAVDAADPTAMPGLIWSPASGERPPADGVLVGTLGDVDHWAVPGSVADGRLFREIASALSDDDAGLLTSAVAVLAWHARAAFCPVCGERSGQAAAGWSRTCPNGHQEWPRTDPAVIVLVHDGADRMVLARQPIWPANRFSVLAGFTEAGESLEATVQREIGEEIGVVVDDIHYLGSQPWPFPRSLMVGFAARAEPGATLTPRDGEIEHAHWVERATVRRLLAGEGEIKLPDDISIARKMIEGWAAADD